MGAIRPVGRSVPTEAELKSEKLRIWKNVLVVSLSIMGLFTAQGVVAVLQVSKELLLNLTKYTEVLIFLGYFK